MRAVVHDRYGPPEVLRIEDVPRPVPKEDEVLVKVHATSVTRTDCGFRAAEPFFSRVFTGLLRPKRRTPGLELAGEVEAVGAAVTEFEVGDEVFGIRGRRERGVHLRPGAGRPGAQAGRHELRGGCARRPTERSSPWRAWARPIRCRDGASSIYGASGAIGTAAVQLAKHFGAHVTAVCNGKNVELVRSLGADVVIDYEREDFTKNGETYDVVFDSVGKHSFRRCRHSLKPGGIFIETDLGFMWHVPPLALLTRWIGDKKVTLPIPKYTKENVLLVKELIEAGQVPRGRRPDVRAGAGRRGDEVRRDGAEDRKRRSDGHVREERAHASPPRNSTGDHASTGYSAKARPRRIAWCSRHAAAASAASGAASWPGSSSGCWPRGRAEQATRHVVLILCALGYARRAVEPGVTASRRHAAAARARRCRSSSSSAWPASRAPPGAGSGSASSS